MSLRRHRLESDAKLNLQTPCEITVSEQQRRQSQHTDKHNNTHNADMAQTSCSRYGPHGMVLGANMGLAGWSINMILQDPECQEVYLGAFKLIGAPFGRLLLSSSYT
jgi:hypothetical protein